MSAREAEAARRRAARTANPRSGPQRKPKRVELAIDHPDAWRTVFHGGRTSTRPLRLSSGGARFALFAFKYLRHTKGTRAGLPLALEPWQFEIVAELFAREDDRYVSIPHETLFDELALVRRLERFLHELDDFESPRIHREALIGLPKKNGKSTLAAAIALYLLMADGEIGAEVYGAAASKDQAKIVFRQARSMVLASEALSTHLRVYAGRIEYPRTDSFYAVVSSDADLQEGVNAHGVVADELHAHKNRTLYDTLRSATIGREEPLFVSITTAGVELETICGEVYTRGAGARPKIRHGVVQARPDKQRSFYFHWRQVDEKKIEDRRSWREANPLSTLTLERLEDERSIERPLSIFIRYHLNGWTRVAKHLFPQGLVEKCVDRTRTLARGDEIVVSVDVGTMHDTFAVGWCGVEKPYPFRGFAWGVWPDPKKPPPAAHDLVEGEGPLDFEVVETFILEELAAAYKIRVVRFDPYKFARSAEILSKAGLEVKAFEQTHTAMVPASEGLFRLVKKRELALANDAVVLAHFDAAAAREIGSGRWRLDKRNAKHVMDLTVCAAMATATADEPGPPKPSFDVL